MMEEARRLRRKLPPTSPDSIRNGEGTLCGCVGEVCVLRMKILPGFKKVESFNHDLMNDTNFTVEIKTVDRTVLPEAHYEGSVAVGSLRQQPNAFCFVSTYRDRPDHFLRGYLMGFWIGSVTTSPWRYVTAGTYDARNKHTVSMDCYKIEYGKLIPVEEFLNRIK